MRKFVLLGALFSLLGCQGRGKTEVAHAVPLDDKAAVSGLPRARAAVPAEPANAPPRVEIAPRTLAPAAVLFSNSEKWAAKRPALLSRHQQLLEQHEIRQENATGKALPRVQVGERNSRPPRIDRGGKITEKFGE